MLPLQLCIQSKDIIYTTNYISYINPSGQSWHSISPSKEYWSSLHLTGSLLAVGHLYPAGHMVQFTALGIEAMKPSGHGQRMPPLGQALPGRQSTQVATPSLMLG